MSKQEKNLVLMLRGVVLESGFFTEEDLALTSLSMEARPVGNLSPSNHGEGLDRNGVGYGGGDPNDDFGGDVARIFGIDAGFWALQETAITPPSPKDDATAWQRQISCLSVAVARLWAEVLSDNHVFDVVTTIGRTLSEHSKSLDST